ncbi:MAG: di-trans,poly-cis-decaprenylcistransferase [Treponema sp. CETP13]|nr:MAG: di-trans,poly-cis-decaprenylcistransferase [Treponema sp. CETP13]
MQLSNLNLATVPTHVGIIMDGNGRWAQQRKLPRSSGHKAGMNTAREIIKAAGKAHIKYLTLYTFSTENWKRSEQEVNFLMFLLKNNLRKEFERYKADRVRVLFSGDINGLPKDVQKEIYDVQNASKDFDGLNLIFAINYGGRDEIIRAIKKLTSDKDFSSEKLTSENFSSFLDIPEMPDADLIIRTGGEKRLSNFLMWHSAYSEFEFSDILWPDYTPDEFYKSIASYQNKDRRFGGYTTGNNDE